MQTTARIGTIILSLGLLCLAVVTRVGGQEPPPQDAAKVKKAPPKAGAATTSVEAPKDDKEPGPKRFKVNLKHAQKQLDLEWAELIQTKKDLRAAEKRIKEKLDEFQKTKSAIDSHRKKSIKSQKDTLERDAKAGKARLERLRKQQADLETKLVEQRNLVEGGSGRVEKSRFQMKIDRLTEICEKMPPDSAARFLEGLELKVATAILARMKVRRAAAVMANLNVETAAKISQRYLKNDFPPPAPKPKKRRN